MKMKMKTGTRSDSNTLEMRGYGVHLHRQNCQHTACRELTIAPRDALHAMGSSPRMNGHLRRFHAGDACIYPFYGMDQSQ